MRNPGIIALVLAYGLSQFYRSFLAVLSPALQQDVGASASDLADAMGVWFLIFALMQIPVGWALDRVGPRRTASVLFLAGGGGGAVLFAMAQAPWHITVAMGLIGMGCAPILMASYYIFARTMPPAVFASLGAVVIGLGSIGNLAASSPMAWAAHSYGWRPALLLLAALTIALALIIWTKVTDPEPAPQAQGGGLLDLLRNPALWLLFPMMLVNYAAAAGLRGLWAGPYTAEIFGADAQLIGQITLVIALAMIAGNFAYGPLDRLLGTRKWVVFGGNLLGALCCAALFVAPSSGVWVSAGLMAAIGFFGCSFPVIIAHGRQFFAPHLVGRGVTLLNLLGISGVGLGQMITGRIYDSSGGGGLEAYRGIFLFYTVAMILGLLIYLFSREERH